MNRLSSESSKQFDLLPPHLRWLLALLLTIALAQLTDTTANADEHQTIPGHLTETNLRIIDERVADVGTATITNSHGLSITLEIPNTNGNTYFQMTSPDTYTMTLKPTDGEATTLYTITSPVTETVVYTAATASYEGVPATGTFSQTTTTLEVGSNPTQTIFPPTVTAFFNSNFGLNTQLNVSDANGLKILQMAATGASGSMEVAQVTTFFEDITIEAAAARPGFKLDATHIVEGVTTELTFRLGQEYPATWIDQPVTVVFSAVDLVAGTGSGTITNKITGEMYSFTGADLNQDDDITEDEIELSLISWGSATCFLPLVVR